MTHKLAQLLVIELHRTLREIALARRGSGRFSRITPVPAQRINPGIFGVIVSHRSCALLRHTVCISLTSWAVLLRFMGDHRWRPESVDTVKGFGIMVRISFLMLTAVAVIGAAVVGVPGTPVRRESPTARFFVEAMLDAT